MNGTDREPPDRLLTVADIVASTKLSERHIRRLIADGTLPVVRLGRTVRVRPAALEGLLNHTAQEAS